MFTKSNFAAGNNSYGCNGGHGKKVLDHYLAGAGGGGAGGNGGNGFSGRGGYAVSCVVIVSEKAIIPDTSISTGGEHGSVATTVYITSPTGGAGGTGFWYMAIGELLDE